MFKTVTRCCSVEQFNLDPGPPVVDDINTTGTDTVPLVLIITGRLDAGETLNVTVTHSISGALVGTTGAATASLDGAAMAALIAADLNGEVALTATASGNRVEILAAANPDTVTFTSYAVV